MAIPTAPTATSIVTEALKLATNSSPSAALITRAEDEWMNQILNDIHFLSAEVGGRLRSLFITAHTVTTAGRAIYPMPDYYGSGITLSLMKGEHTGTAQDGVVGSITLDATEDITAADAQGKYCIITANTGVGSASQITSHNATSKVSPVSPDFNTAPDGTSTYLLVDSYRQLDSIDIETYAYNTDLDNVAEPTEFTPTGDDDWGELILRPVPDAVYGLRMRYYADLMTIDLTSTVMTTLYRRWRNIFHMGIFARALEDREDDRRVGAWRRYNSLLRLLMLKENEGDEIADTNFQLDTRR
jgi:hypothetical protein